MKKTLLGLSKVTALHYILPVTFFDAHDEITKLLWDCVVEQEPTAQESHGPTDKWALLPFSLRHMGNTQSVLACSIQKKFTPSFCYQGKKTTHLQQNSFIVLHSWTPTQEFKFRKLRVIHSLAVHNTFPVWSSTLRGNSLEAFFNSGGSFTFVIGK